MQDTLRIHEFRYDIAPTDQEMKWWCVNCRNLIFFSHHKVIAVAEEGPLNFAKAPITMICSKCRSHIHIQFVM